MINSVLKLNHSINSTLIRTYSIYSIVPIYTASASNLLFPSYTWDNTLTWDNTKLWKNNP